MRANVQDQEIVKLLTKLKEAEKGYPQELFSARRQRYLEQIGTVGLGLGAGKSISEAIRDVKNPPASTSVTSTLLETVLLVAIVAEAGTVAFLYRDKVADFLRTFSTSPRVQEVTPPPVVPPSQVAISVTSTPGTTLTAAMPTLSPSPTGTAGGVTQTPGPGDVVEEINPAIGLPTQAVSTQVPPTRIASTPIPNDDNGDNGNHYGQTPKPERTKVPENDNQTPKDNQGPPP